MSPRRATDAGLLVNLAFAALLVATAGEVDLLPFWATGAALTAIFVVWWDSRHQPPPSVLGAVDVLLLALAWPGTLTSWFLMHESDRG